MSDQLARQAVIVPAAAQDPNRLSEKLSLFKEDGSPFSPEYPKLLAGWFVDEYPAPVVLPFESYAGGTQLRASLKFNEVGWASTYVDPDVDLAYFGDSVRPGTTLDGVGFIPQNGHAYKFSSVLGLSTPVLGSVVADVDGTWGYTHGVRLEPGSLEWTSENGIYAEKFDTVTVTNVTNSALQGSFYNAISKNQFYEQTILVPYRAVPQHLVYGFRAWVPAVAAFTEFPLTSASIAIFDLGPVWPAP